MWGHWSGPLNHLRSPPLSSALLGVLKFAELSCDAGCEHVAESDLVYSHVVTQVGPDCSIITTRFVL